MNGVIVDTTIEKPVSQLSNDSIIIRLLYTVNHLSRWLTPVHEDIKLTRSANRDELSVKDYVVRMRDHELQVYPKLYAIANQDRPDLDAQQPIIRSGEDLAFDRQAKVLEIMGEFRRVRQSTTSL
ncbi:MAG: hypothetical protein ACR2J8_03615, partial [Thermomicrobiales bacterium]